VDVFTISRSGATIILTRTANAFPGGRIDFTISASRLNLAMTRVGTFSSWWVTGFEDLTCTFTNSPKAYSNSSGYFINDTGGSYVCTRSIGANVYLFGVYNTLLADIAAGKTNEEIKAGLLSVSQAINLASENFRLRWLVSFADCSSLGQVCYTVQSNLLKWNTTAGTDVSPLQCQSSGTPPSSGAEPEQTQITVHYVNKQGFPLSNTTVSVGYPPDNNSGRPATILHTAPALLTGYTPVTDPAVLATTAGILGVNSSQMLSNASNSDLNYPSGSVNSGILHVYYVYEPWTAPINPHIRQRAGN
jgi:hypothetical protein